MKVTLVHDRRKDGKNSIEAKVYFPKYRRQLYYSTGVGIDKKYFDEEKQAFSINTPGYKNVIEQITSFQEGIEKAVYNFNADNPDGKPTQFNKYFKHFKKLTDKVIERRNSSFTQFMADELRDSVELVESTKISQGRTLSLLNEFNSDLTFSEINWMFAKDFDRFLREHYTNLNTIVKHHEVVKKYVNAARKLLYVEADGHSSYLGFVPKKQEVNKDILLPEEIKAIEDLDVTDKPVLDEVREMFLVAYYTALRISDINELSSGHINKVNGDLELDKVIYKLRKINRRIRINLSKIHNGKPAEIIQKRMFTENGIIFNQHQTGGNVNVYLKKIAELAGINKNVSFHTARHTMLTMIALKTGSVFTVMKYGGITSIHTANRYIHLSSKLFDDKIAEIIWE